METTDPGRVGATRPPDLDDPARFRRVADVPILDVHEHEAKGDVDEALLHLLAANTNRRCDRGDLVALTIGHTRHGDAAREEDQPPIVGFARRLSVGTFRGEPCLLADFFLRAGDADRAMDFPHRSIERVTSADPADNYIDYVSLLRRPPERSLGLLTYARDLPAGASVVRYERDFPAAPAEPVPAPAGPTPPPPPTEPAAMDPETLAQIVTQAVTAAMQPIVDAMAAALSADATPPAPVEEPAPTPPVADAPPAVDPPADPDADDPTRVQDSESTPSGDNVFVPGMVEEKDRVQMQRTIRGLTAKLQDAEGRLDMAEAQTARLQYERAFDGLEKEGVEFAREKELDAILALPKPFRDGHIERMRTQYRRTSIGQSGHIPTADPARPADPDAAITPEDRQGIIDYATRHKVFNPVEARTRYFEAKGKRA